MELSRLTVQECIDGNRKEGKVLVINDGIVLKFEPEGRKGADRNAESLK